MDVALQAPGKSLADPEHAPNGANWKIAIGRSLRTKAATPYLLDRDDLEDAPPRRRTRLSPTQDIAISGLTPSADSPGHLLGRAAYRRRDRATRLPIDEWKLPPAGR